LTKIAYHGVTGTIQVQSSDGIITYECGVTKGWDFSVEWDTEEIYDPDSSIRRDVIRKRCRVPISFRYCEFSGKILGAILGTTTADTDVDGSAAAGRTRASIQDDESCPLFRVYGRVTDGTNFFRVRVDSIYFPSFPFTVPDNDFLQIDLKGVGAAIYLEYAS